MNRTYICIDLKSFYASVECVERGLDPLKVNLVVADASRTEKTICLAITPSLKQYGLSGRARLFEVIQKVKEVNKDRDKKKDGPWQEKSYDDTELKKNPNLKLDFIIAPPRMRLYMQYSMNIYKIYLQYFSPEDLFAYSIDEIFCDITDYLSLYKKTAEEFVTEIIHDVYQKTGITATAGIGTNLYLAKIAMDIVAKRKTADEHGVRIAFLDEEAYKNQLWDYQPITDFWRIGKGTASRLAKGGMHTMGDIARCSLENENKLFKMFGINAELIIDHAWGWEPCTIKDVKNYKPKQKSLSSSQVLFKPYNYTMTKQIVKEMTELLILSLVEKKGYTKQLFLTIDYDQSNSEYFGEKKIDYYGRSVPKPAHGTISLSIATSSRKTIMETMLNLYEKIINPNLSSRRVTIAFGNIQFEKESVPRIEQLNLFENSIVEEPSEQKIQQVILNIQKKYGKNSILKGMNLEEGGTTIERNKQIGGHKE